MRISDWSSDVCSSDLNDIAHVRPPSGKRRRQGEPFRLIVGDGNVEVRGLGLGKHRRGLKRAEARAGVPEEEAGLATARDKDVSADALVGRARARASEQLGRSAEHESVLAAEDIATPEFTRPPEGHIASPYQQQTHTR